MCRGPNRAICCSSIRIFSLWAEARERACSISLVELSMFPSMGASWFGVGVLRTASPDSVSSTSESLSEDVGGGGGGEVLVVARASAVTTSHRAAAIPAAHEADSHPFRVVGPPPNHSPAPRMVRIATVAPAAHIHRALSMPLIVSRQPRSGGVFR